jgi:hypothetical protein
MFDDGLGRPQAGVRPSSPAGGRQGLAGSQPGRYATDGDMVADVRAFAKALGERRAAGVRVRTDVIAGENRLTVAPVLITRGLMWALGPQR